MTMWKAAEPPRTPHPCRRIHRGIRAAFGDTGGYGIALPTRYDTLHVLVLWNGFHGLPRLGIEGQDRATHFWRKINQLAWMTTEAGNPIEPLTNPNPDQVPRDVLDRIWRTFLLSEREFDAVLPFMFDLKPFARRVARIRGNRVARTSEVAWEEVSRKISVSGAPRGNSSARRLR
jgi:hypothetical protein